MVLKVSSPKSGHFPPPNNVSDAEKEISDDDDDDRNHKHRRRESGSHSSDKDALEQEVTRPYRKHNKTSGNRYMVRENELQASQSWKNHNTEPSEKDIPMKFEKRNGGSASLPRVPLEFHQRIRSNQSFSADAGLGRGRGRDFGSWSSHDSRFTSVDIASQMVRTRPILPNLFPGRGLQNITNAPNASWGTYGSLPGAVNGGVDTLNPIGSPGTFSSSHGIGIPRQRCRDFEERGFCLRGDMCPMEHGINRIVVEDVQSLSQFDLPVSLSNAPILGNPSLPVPLPFLGAASTSLPNNRCSHNKNGQYEVADDSVASYLPYSNSGDAASTDLYDPDQPLWNNGGEPSPALVAMQSPLEEETETYFSDDVGHETATDQQDGQIRHPLGSRMTGSSVWERIGNTKGKIHIKGNTDLTKSTSASAQTEAKEKEQALRATIVSNHKGKHVNGKDGETKDVGSSHKIQNRPIHSTRKQTEKAQRTLYVNGIPLSSNKKEALLSHFQKFGMVIDIHIPLNSERAFVQFSKREEAEAALKAPDAVMGNRFIKLWWANRDNIPDNGMSNTDNVSLTPKGTSTGTIHAVPSVDNRGKENNQYAVTRSSDASLSDTLVDASGQFKSPTASGPKVVVALQKKRESLEQLKEELRKKQEMLDKKRNDFRLKLDKLAKQAMGHKNEVVAEQVVKRQKVESSPDASKAVTPKSSDSATMTLRSSHSVDSTTASHDGKMGSKSIAEENSSVTSSFSGETNCGDLERKTAKNHGDRKDSSCASEDHFDFHLQAAEEAECSVLQEPDHREFKHLESKGENNQIEALQVSKQIQNSVSSEIESESSPQI